MKRNAGGCLNMLDRNMIGKGKKRNPHGGILLAIRMHMTLTVFAAVFLLGIFFGSTASGFLDLSSYSGLSEIMTRFLL